MSDGWIGVDLDGTLAQYDGWNGPAHIGPPVPAMLARVKRWLGEGREVRIFTARVSEGPEQVEAALAIHHWVQEHVGQKLTITNVKDFAMLELWDDRAVQVTPNTGEPVGQSTRGLDRQTVIPERMAELGGYIECLEAWGTDSPDEAADEIRKFLTDPEYGIEHLREDAEAEAAS